MKSKCFSWNKKILILKHERLNFNHKVDFYSCLSPVNTKLNKLKHKKLTIC